MLKLLRDLIVIVEIGHNNMKYDSIEQMLRMDDKHTALKLFNSTTLDRLILYNWLCKKVEHGIILGLVHRVCFNRLRKEFTNTFDTGLKL